MKQKDKDFIRDFVLATASEEAKQRYEELFKKWFDPKGKRGEIYALLDEANEKIKQACDLARKTKTSFAFEPYGWNGFDRAFSSSKDAEIAELFIDGHMKLEDLEALVGFDREGESPPGFDWIYWSASSLSC